MTIYFDFDIIMFVDSGKFASNMVAAIEDVLRLHPVYVARNLKEFPWKITFMETIIDEIQLRMLSNITDELDAGPSTNSTPSRTPATPVRGGSSRHETPNIGVTAATLNLDM